MIKSSLKTAQSGITARTSSSSPQRKSRDQLEIYEAGMKLNCKSINDIELSFMLLKFVYLLNISTKVKGCVAGFIFQRISAICLLVIKI